jgi:predicted lysophospholipase L1 biosynthesis ABC-type transport system permease subunit
MINEAGMRQWFTGEDPIARFVQVNGVRIEIVGLVADVLQRDASRPVQSMLFVPYTQRSARTLRVVVRSAGDPMAQAAAIRGALRQIDPNLPMLATRPLTELVADSVARPRFYMSLLALFAAVALILAATGIFGVMSYAVAQRSREISIRMALGATTNGILRQTLGGGLTLAAVGAVLGVGAALALGRVIQSQLFGVSVLDPITIVTGTATLIVSAVLATVLPARRASMLDPARVLR